MGKKLLSENVRKFNAKATKEDCVKDLRAVQIEYPEKFITRNYYRKHGKYSDSTWDRFFGTFKEFRRQAGLELTRQQAQLEVQIAKHESLEHYNEFFTNEVLPYHEKYVMKNKPSKIKTILVAGDFHDKESHRFCLEVFIDTCVKMQPDVIVLNGDVFDLYEFSRFNIDPRQCDMVARFKFVKEQLFKRLREGCPDTQIDFIIGNHELRLIKHLADKTPYIRMLMSDILHLGFAEVFGLDEYKINWHSKIDIKAFSPKDINNMMKKNFKIYFDCYVVAHTWDNGFSMSGTSAHHHQLEVRSDYNVLTGPTTWVQTPGMHNLHAEYLDDTCKWNLGFLIVHIDTEKKTVIQNPILVNEEWAIINGLYYKNK